MAQLKDLIVNGPTRLIGNAYGLISSASTTFSATTAVSAVTSNSATTSTSAKTAYSATTATSAKTAYSATTANSATTAVSAKTSYSASTATSAKTANSATTATSATTAVSAKTAYSATTATSATTAVSAKTAYSATTATSATTVPVTNCAATLTFGETKTIAKIGGYNLTVTMPTGTGGGGDQGPQGADGYMIYCGSDTELTGKSNTVWTGRTGSNSGVSRTVKFTNIAPAEANRRDIIVGDYVLFWGQDTDNNGHINMARITNLSPGTGVSFNVTGTVVSAIIAPKGAQGDQGAPGSGGGGGGTDLQTKGLSSGVRGFLLVTSSQTATGTAVTLSSGNTFRAMGSTTGTGVYVISNSIYATSDERMKNFLGDIDVDLDAIREIPKKYFTWKDDEDMVVNIGTSAQKLNRFYPELVDGDGTGMLAVSYEKLSVIALAAIDKLHDENIELKEKIKVLEDKIDTLLNE